LASLTLLRPRNLGVAVALVALALAACSHSGTSTVSPGGGATATPTPNPSSSPLTCTQIATGAAFIPDGGNGGTFHGVQVVHFEDSSGNLCTSATILTVPFVGSVGALGAASDGTTALAAVSNNGGTTFTQIQDLFGVGGTSLIPAGMTYDVTVTPTPLPSTTPTPSGAVVLSDVNSIAVLGSGSSSVGLIGGIGTGILGLTQLANAPPIFGGFIPFQGATPDPGVANRPIVAVAPTPGSALARGPSDLLVFSVTIVSTGYQFQLMNFDKTMGYGAHNLRGAGNVAISADGSHALIAGAPGPNDVTLINNLPNSINKASTITLASRPHSVSISGGGLIAAVGADNGVYIITGVSTTAISLVAAFAPNPFDTTASAPTFTGCDGHVYRMTNVSSVGFSADERYLVLIGSPPTQVCASGYNSSLVAVPIDTTSGLQPTPAPSPSPTAGPTQFTANGIVTRPTDTDYVIVR
jgi:hypothetical protein